MSGRATLTMNRSRLASTIPAQAIARTWLGFVRSTGTSLTSTADLRLTLCSPYALDDQLRPVRHGLKDRDAPLPEIAVEFCRQGGKFGPHGDRQAERRWGMRSAIFIATCCVQARSPCPPGEQGSARAQERVSAPRRRTRHCLSGSLPAPFWLPGAWHNRPSCGGHITRKAAGTGPWCRRLMPVREECARAKAN